MEGNKRRTSATAGDKGAAAYERQKRRAAERSRRTSLAGREIAPLPPIFNARRRAACKYDLALFLRTYLPKKFKKSFSRNHLRYIRTLQDAILNGGLRAIAMPRGAGKTTIVKGAVVWAILYGWHKYVLVVSATKTEATELLADVKKSFVSERIREDFPEVAVPLARLGGSALLARGQLFEGEATGIVWQTDKIKTPTIPGSAASAATIRAVGINGAIRGASTDGVDGETARPSLVVCDDLQKIEDAKNPERVKKICDKIERDIIGLAADGDSMTVVMVCTCIEPDDVSAIYLSPETRPQWNGLRFKMVERFPDRLDDLWLREYASRRRKSAKEANAFYAEHREAMDAGAVVDWPENYDRKKEASRLQRAMNYLIDDEASFWSERQNEPRTPETASLVCDARTIRSRTNGLERFQVPNDATTLTAFIDVHADVLYYAVCAFKDDRTCFVVDYGAFPEQREEYFFKGRSGNATLKQTFAFADVDGGIQEGVFSLIHQILGETWLSVSGHVLSISRLMVDVGYRRDPVESAIRRVGVPVVSPAKGRAIGAARKPMSEWTPKPGAKVGNRWIAEPTPGRAFKTITTDVNFFKSEVHAAFAAPVGSVAGASLWGSVGRASSDVRRPLLRGALPTGEGGGERSRRMDGDSGARQPPFRLRRRLFRGRRRPRVAQAGRASVAAPGGRRRMSGNNGTNGNGGSCATWRAARLRFLYNEITRLSNALSEAGATASITVDGVSTTFDRAGTLATIKEYRREIAALEGRSSSLKTFGLGGPWR